MLLAVYGTLKKDYIYHYLLDGTKFIGKDKVKGQMYLIKGIGYPFLMEGNKDIDVEIYEVQKERMEIITQMEENVGYKGKMTKLESGKEAMVFWSSLVKLIDKY